LYSDGSRAVGRPKDELMADKSAKEKDAPKPAEGEKKPAVNKQTAKVMQDGVELTWDLQREGEVDADAAAKFYTQSVDALRKFRDADPRTMPELRKAKKTKDDNWQAFVNQAKGVLVGIILVLLFGAYRNCDTSASEGPRRYQRDPW